MRKNIILVLCFLLFPILIIAGSEKDEAMSLYFSGKDAYNSGNYYDAQRYLQNAIVKNPDIEAKAPNIKYMLGVSAFNNKDYKTANTYLSLFLDNPIAADLLLKIGQFEDTQPDEFLYYNTIHDGTTKNASKTEVTSASETTAGNESTGVNPLILLAVISILIIAIALFLEIKINTFSKLALKLVGVTPEFLNTQREMRENKGSAQDKNDASISEDAPFEANDKVLLDTPFDEEINIDEMASKDISELTKFFGDTEPVFPEEEVTEEVLDTSGDLENEEFQDARSSILNSVLEDDDEAVISASASEENKEELNSYKPKYEHLDNIPDDFDVNAAISIAYELIEKAEKETPSEKADKDWTPISEFSESLEEQEKFNINYFQNMDNLDEKNLDKYYNFIFEKHGKKAV